LEQNTNLKDLFAKYLAGNATAYELSALLDYFRLEKDSGLLREMILQEFETEETSAPTETQIAILNRVSTVLKYNIERKKARLRSMYIGWAAAAAMLIVAGLWVGLQRLKEQTQLLAGPSEMIMPGQDKAILELGDGKIIHLDSSASGINNSYVFADANGVLTLNSEGLRPSGTEPEERTLRTPKGGQFAVVLSDGTKVWLNAASSITFPAVFGPSTREVRITGEVYFEVAKNKAKPFLTYVGQQVVKVLGTHFNINAYPENEAIETSLLEGSVTVIAGGKHVQLQPGQMSSWRQNQDGLDVSSIPDANNLLAWREGMFCFDNSNIEEIMRVLSRWYDIEFSFENGDYSNCVFDGMISRKKSIQEVLNILAASNQLDFKIKGRKVIVSRTAL